MRKRIKVLETIRQGQIGGGESHLLSLVENLDSSQYEPVVLSFTDGPMVERLANLGIQSHVIHTERPFDVSKWKKVKKFLKEQQVDIIHAHGTRAHSNISWAAKSLNIPVVYTIHGWAFHSDQKSWVQLIRKMGESYLTTKADVNISVSPSNQQTGKRYIKSFKSIIVNNGIDLKKFNPNNPYKDIRLELGIPSDKVLVLFLARFTAHKQPLALIEAFAKAIALNPSLHLLMVGDGDQKAVAKQIIADQNLKESITLTSFRSDVPAILSAADIFVLPSLWEGLPIGLLEAMAMGKAIVATKVDGTIDIVESNVNGLLIDTANLIPDLTRALINLGGDPEKRKSLGSKAMHTVSESFNAFEMTKKIEDIYRKVLEKQKVSAIK